MSSSIKKREEYFSFGLYLFIFVLIFKKSNYDPPRIIVYLPLNMLFLRVVLYNCILGHSRVEEMATHSSILPWSNLWTENPDGLKSMASQELQRVAWGHKTKWLNHHIRAFVEKKKLHSKITVKVVEQNLTKSNVQITSQCLRLFPNNFLY